MWNARICGVPKLNRSMLVALLLTAMGEKLRHATTGGKLQGPSPQCQAMLRGSTDVAWMTRA